MDLERDLVLGLIGEGDLESASFIMEISAKISRKMEPIHRSTFYKAFEGTMFGSAPLKVDPSTGIISFSVADIPLLHLGYEIETLQANLEELGTCDYKFLGVDRENKPTVQFRAI